MRICILITSKVRNSNLEWLSLGFYDHNAFHDANPTRFLTLWLCLNVFLVLWDNYLNLIQRDIVDYTTFNICWYSFIYSIVTRQICISWNCIHLCANSICQDVFSWLILLNLSLLRPKYLAYVFHVSETKPPQRFLD